MAIADRIAAAQADITEYQGIVTQVSNLQNQLDTANLQHANDKAAIDDLTAQVAEDVKERQATELLVAGLQTKLATADSLLATDADMIGKQAVDIQKAQMQLLQLESVKVYDGLEYNPWAINSKSEVGGSGVGTAGSKVPDATGMAELWIKPGPRPIAANPNYFDSYNTQDFPLDDAITRWRMENTFLFPTQADANACNCLELEARQVLLNGNMFVGGTQFNFGNNAWRYWDHFKKWTPSGQPCPTWTAGKLYHAAVDAHRDAANTYHDSISLNDQKIPLAVSYSTWKESPAWRQMLRCAIQLDAKDVAFRVLIGRTKFTVSQ